MLKTSTSRRQVTIFFVIYIVVDGTKSKIIKRRNWNLLFSEEKHSNKIIIKFILVKHMSIEQLATH